MYGRTYQNWHQPTVMLSMVMFITLLYGGKSYAKPDMTPLGPNIAERGSSFYHFSVKSFDSADGKRHYRVWTGLPAKLPPPSGYPILYMLDGNAVMDRLSETFLAQLSEKTPPVIVAIGYQTDLPFAQRARAYDYTPATNSVELSGFGRDSRKGGGNVMFRQLIENDISHSVEKDIKINPDKRGIWGHSFGGLFVLDSWLLSSFFHFYYSASPSLGRDDFALLARMKSINKRDIYNKHLYFMEGVYPAKKNAGSDVTDALSSVRDRVLALSAEWPSVAYWHYPGFTHGQMFNASFQTALLLAGAQGGDGKKIGDPYHP